LWRMGALDWSKRNTKNYPDPQKQDTEPIIR
jgi:hypothetical protein